MITLHPDEIIVDSFAGGGGASTGIEQALGRPVDIAINHNDQAIAMHRANHPGTVHLTENVWRVDPLTATGGRPVGLMWLSPDCTHFSRAKGAAPVSPRVRGLAWVAVHWAKAVRPRVMILENVEEFQTWGPISDGKPCKARRGQTFRKWWRKLQKLGYRVEMRSLRACDYGAPTSRKRLFIIARCDGKPIYWPEPSHGPGRIPYRTAADCIDWSIPCPSIFEREKPLVEKTLQRIARGITRYVIDNPRPFIVPVTHNGSVRAYDTQEPLKTVTGAQRGEFALISPRLIEYHSATHKGGDRAKPLAQTLPTQDTSNRFGLVVPTLIQTGYGEREGQSPRVPGLDKPLGTVVSGGKHALVSAFMAQHNGGFYTRAGNSVDAPLSTITHRGTQQQVVTSHLCRLKGTCQDGQPTDQPIGAIQAGGNHYAEVRALLISYYGTDQDPLLTNPLPTVTTRDRFGLVTINGAEWAIVDIGMRMLQPRELYRAQGFPDSYVIDPPYQGKPLTKTAQIMLCGNSVVPAVAEAIVRANFGGSGHMSTQLEIADLGLEASL